MTAPARFTQADIQRALKPVSAIRRVSTIAENIGNPDIIAARADG